MRKINFFLLHILVGVIILLLAFKANDFIWSKILVFTILLFFLVALVNHFNEIDYLEKKRCGLDCFKLLGGTFLAAAFTWYINHRLGFGPIIANGLVGVIASMFFTKNAGPYYIASFIGMSSLVIIPSMFMAGLAGILAGVIIVFSQEIYNGVGGKGGTIAAISTQVLRVIVSFFI